MKKALIVLGLLASNMVLADIGATAISGSGSSSDSASISGALSNSTGGYSSATGGASTATGGVSSSNSVSKGGAAGAISGAASAENSQSITFNQPGVVDYKGSYTMRNVPGLSTGAVFPTSPCMGSSSIGAAGVGFGISVGSSWTDHECGKRETARSFASIGLTNDALKILCSSEYSSAAPSCASVTPLPAQTPVKGAVRDCQSDPYIAKRTGVAACQ